MIKVDGLVKWFGPNLVVDKVSFEVGRGEVLGFLGPNGAGKSTTMRMITGFLPMSDGTVSIGGHSMADDELAAKALIGYLPENAPAYPEMSVEGFLRFVAAVRGLHGTARDAAVERAVQACFLDGVRRQTIETLSKGYRHRTCFAQAMLHDPPILILDEPTDGLDPNQKHEMRTLIRRMGVEGNKAIILSTHILEEVDAVCTRVIIIDRGRIVFNGTPAELRGRSKLAGAVSVRVQNRDEAALHGLLAGVAEAGPCEVLETTAAGLRLRVQPAAGTPAGKLAPAMVRKLHETGAEFDELHTDAGRLDEVFRAITVPDTARTPAAGAKPSNN